MLRSSLTRSIALRLPKILFAIGIASILMVTGQSCLSPDDGDDGDGDGDGGGNGVTTPMVVLGYNELGMHCMNQDFSELMILPPYNTLHAQVIDRERRAPADRRPAA